MKQIDAGDENRSVAPHCDSFRKCPLPRTARVPNGPDPHVLAASSRSATTAISTVIWKNLPVSKRTGKRKVRSGFQPFRVLLVDDNRTFREVLRMMLEARGEFVVVGEAGGGDEAVCAAAELSPDIVVMDLVMPGKDGVDACREIMDTAPETRVVMLTACTEDDAMIEAANAGAAACLHKVAGMTRLISTLKNVAAGGTGV